MKCPLCTIREADKKNTHYFTDKIIRSCLNLDGGNERETGFYFDLSNDTAFVEFNFQRETSIPKLEETLGRVATEEEIEQAKKIPFSVDYVFCTNCEAIFTEIEDAFINRILPKLRDAGISELEELDFEYIKIIRLFFYIQIWRTAVCEKAFKLSPETFEKLRLIIINNVTITDQEIKNFPLGITYLETLGGEKEYTSNFVGFTNDRKPNLVILNDFVIQFYESNEDVKFFDFYNLNNHEFEKFANFNEDKFKIRILHDAERKAFLKEMVREEKVKQTLSFYRSRFSEFWFKLFGVDPPSPITEQYIYFICNQEDDLLSHTRENIIKLTQEFLIRKLQ